MNQTKHKVSKEEKAKIVLAILRGDQTANEIASQYGVHPNLISRWKQQAVNNMAGLFEDERERVDRKMYREQVQKIERLEKLVGQREYELDWLKKKLSIFDHERPIKVGRPQKNRYNSD